MEILTGITSRLSNFELTKDLEKARFAISFRNEDYRKITRK